MWMPLINLTQEMGTMVFASTSQLGGAITDISISPESDQFFVNLVREKGFPLVSYPLDAGDATFHSGWTAHAAHANSSDQLREVMTIIYYADGTSIMEPDNEFRKVDMEVFHPGQKPGDLAASELNPVLYSEE
jgi:ectoine hydroxylase-related dioxygenase (phytanoyl-CoA dioxygenase family)